MLKLIFRVMMMVMNKLYAPGVNPPPGTKIPRKKHQLINGTKYTSRKKYTKTCRIMKDYQNTRSCDWKISKETKQMEKFRPIEQKERKATRVEATKEETKLASSKRK